MKKKTLTVRQLVAIAQDLTIKLNDETNSTAEMIMVVGMMQNTLAQLTFDINKGV